MNVSKEQFKAHLKAWFKATPDKKTLVSCWGTNPQTINDEEVIYVGLQVNPFAPANQKEADLIVKQLPPEIDGVKLVYYYTGEIKVIGEIPWLDLQTQLKGNTSIGRTERHDLLIGGISFGAIDISAGTLANVVYDADDFTPYLLTNEHVVSNTQNTNPDHPPEGHPIVQPGPVDGGSYPADVAGYLDRVGGMKEAALNDEPSDIDAALVNPERVFDPEQFWGLGFVEAKKHVEAEINDEIIKSGRTTGVSSTTVADTNVSANIGGVAWRDPVEMEGLIQTTSSISEGGDSGSRVWKETTMEPIGIIFAGSIHHTLIIPAQTICDKFNVMFEGVGDPGIEIQIAGETLVTDEMGQAIIKLRADKYPYIVSYPKFKDKEGEIDVDYAGVDLSLILPREVYKATFNVTDLATSVPVENVEVALAGQTEYTDNNGVAVFAEVPWKETDYLWILRKEYFEVKSGEAHVHDSDITVNAEILRYGIIEIADPYLDVGEENPAIEVILSGAVFNDDGSESDLSNWEIDVGQTGLILDHINRINNATVQLNFIGEASEGTIAIKVYAGALDVTLDSNSVSILVFIATVPFNVSYAGEPLNNASVTFREELKVTGEEGSVVFENVGRGIYDWEVLRTGFKLESGTAEISEEHIIEDTYEGVGSLSGWIIMGNHVRFNQNCGIIGMKFWNLTVGSAELRIMSPDREITYHSEYIPSIAEGWFTFTFPTINVVTGDEYMFEVEQNPIGYVRGGPNSYEGPVWDCLGLYKNGSLFSSNDSMAMGFVLNRAEKNIEVVMELA